MYIIISINNTITSEGQLCQQKIGARIHTLSSWGKLPSVRPKSWENILSPLYKMELLFPYTPMVQVQHATVN